MSNVQIFPLNLPQQSIHEDGSDKFTTTKNSDSRDATILNDNDVRDPERETHVHTIDCEKNMGNWCESLTFRSLPSIEPLQEANIILSLKVSIRKLLSLIIVQNFAKWNVCLVLYVYVCLRV